MSIRIERITNQKDHYMSSAAKAPANMANGRLSAGPSTPEEKPALPRTPSPPNWLAVLRR
jgi:hypothetical protein